MIRRAARRSTDSWREWNDFSTNQGGFRIGHLFSDKPYVEANISLTQAKLQLPGTLTKSQFDSDIGQLTSEPWRNMGRESDINLEQVEKGSTIFRKIQSRDRTFMCGGFELNDTGGRHIGAILTLTDISGHVVVAHKANNATLRMAIMFFVVTFSAGLLISRSITRPILKLVDMAKAIGGGNLNQRVSVDSDDEIGEVGRTFNDMIEKRKQAEEALIERTTRTHTQRGYCQYAHGNVP